MENESLLATEKISSLMRKYSIPCIISLLVGALYNIVDQIFIANASYLGSFGNAANTVVFPLTVIALAVAVMIGDGCCAFVSINLGSGSKDNAAKGVGNSIIVILTSSMVITFIYLIFSDHILTMFGARVNDETFSMAKEYFFYISLGIPFYMFGQAVNPIIRADGSPKYAMASLLGGSVLNCILDPVFIFIFHWGMMGAAVATVAGQIMGAAFSLAYLFRMKLIRLTGNSFIIEWKLVFRMLQLGITSFLAQISVVLSMAAVLNMVEKYGALDPIFGQAEYAQIPTAVIGIVMKFFQIVISIAIGLAAGCIPVVGYNTGAKLKLRVKEIVKKTVR
jgi:putative MATE family efflux protein